MYYCLVSAIEWDTDGQKVDLPETIGVLIDEDHFGEGIENDIVSPTVK